MKHCNEVQCCCNVISTTTAGTCSVPPQGQSLLIQSCPSKNRHHQIPLWECRLYKKAVYYMGNCLCLPWKYFTASSTIMPIIICGTTYHQRGGKVIIRSLVTLLLSKSTMLDNYGLYFQPWASGKELFLSYPPIQRVGIICKFFITYN